MSPPNRREFLERAAGALAVTGSPLVAKEKRKGTVPTRRRVLGANDRINIALIGTGMRCQGLLKRDYRLRKERRDDFDIVAVCDVWEPRLKYTQEETRAPKAYRDFREVLQRPDIDGVVVAVPDHWHYQIATEACLAGKDVYLEKPMTHTVDEAARLTDLVDRTGCIVQVGGTGPAVQLFWKINEYIRSGKMGKILWGLISYNRNSVAGEWDYPIPGLGEQSWPTAEVSPKNLDWQMWLGPARKRPFSPERYFRWRKYWDYSGGNATDLLYHRLGMISTMIGFDFPTRVTSAGGIYVQKDREVPDTYMSMVDYPGRYSINMISCMGNSQSVPITIYGNWGTLQVPEGRGGTWGPGAAQAAVIKAEKPFLKQFQEANGGRTEVSIEAQEGPSLTDDWLDCLRTRRLPLYHALRGYQVMVAIGLGVDSYRSGHVMNFEPELRKTLHESMRVPEPSHSQPRSKVDAHSSDEVLKNG